MPRTNGVYNLPSPPMPLVPDTLAKAEEMNQVLLDIAQAITGSMAVDGSTAWTGNWNANGFNLGGVGQINATNLAVTGATSLATVNVTGQLNAAGLAISGNMSAGNGFFGNIYVGWPNANDFVLDRNPPLRALQWATNWYDSWNEQNGTRTWIGPSGGLMTLDGSGDLWVAGWGTFAGLTASGNLNVGQVLYISEAQVSDFYMTRSAPNRVLNWAAGGWVDGWSESGGLRFWNGSSGSLMTLDAGGTLNAVGQINAGSFISAIGYRCRSGNNGVFRPDYFNIDWNGSSGAIYIDNSDVFGFSDRRVKKNIRTAPGDALNRLMQLRAVEFEIADVGIFKGDGQVKLGLIADEVEGIVPSAVRGAAGAVFKDGTPNPQALTELPLIALLIQAVQELAARR